MNRATSIALIGAPLLLLLASLAHAQGITLTFNNNTSHNLRVTVYDMTLHNPKPVISAEVLNGFASITVPVSVDESGHGHIRWTATTLDHDSPQCSQQDEPSLSEGTVIHVFASGSCGGGGR